MKIKTTLLSLLISSSVIMDIIVTSSIITSCSKKYNNVDANFGWIKLGNDIQIIIPNVDEFNKLCTTIDQLDIAGYTFDKSEIRGFSFGPNFNLESVGDSFLYNCKWLNSPIWFPECVKKIGHHCFEGCSRFNSMLILPSSLTAIGDGFLKECTTFNNKLNLPSSLIKVGIEFLNQGKNMTSTIFFGDLHSSVFDSSRSPQNTWSTDDNQCNAYKSGLDINGTYKDEIISTFPERTETSPFRHYKQS